MSEIGRIHLLVTIATMNYGYAMMLLLFILDDPFLKILWKLTSYIKAEDTTIENMGPRFK